MLNRSARAAITRIFEPVARLLLRLGISPDAVTVVGTLGVVAGALLLYPRGELLWGTLVIAAFVFADNVDGIMARLSGRSGTWGAFLDSTLDRLADAAIFVGLVLWFVGAAAGRGTDEQVAKAGAWAALACLVLGSVVPYARARAEGLGMTASGGLAERADRVLVVLVAVLAHGLGAPAAVLVAVLWLLALASAWTVAQRMRSVHRQAHERLAAADAPVAGR